MQYKIEQGLKNRRGLVFWLYFLQEAYEVMGRGRLREWNELLLRELIAVGAGKAPADIYFAGGKIIDVYRGTLREANVAVKGRRIAYVGLSDHMVGPGTQVIDVSGKILAPGYIEPHGHPFQLYNPLAYANRMLQHGTLVSVNDDFMLFMLLEMDELLELLDILYRHPVKMLWSARLDPQTYGEEAAARFSREKIDRLIQHPLFLQIGELTDWPSLLNGAEKFEHWMAEAARWGKKIEGHTPGASERTLNQLVAAGITACHEALSAEDVLRRVELGIYATLRHSSLRPDLPVILPGLLSAKEPVGWERMMLTTDAPTPAFFRAGYTDHILRVAMESGLPPITAYQMVTRNPAVYYGLEGEVGGIAPGCLADILVLDALEEPSPRQVFAEGSLVLERGKDGKVSYSFVPPAVDWAKAGFRPLSPKREAETLDTEWIYPRYGGESSFPGIELIDPVVTRRSDIPIDGELLAAEEGKVKITARGVESGLCYIALLSRDFRRVAAGIVRGFASSLEGLASSYTGSFDLLLIGQKPAVMLAALKRLQELGGGIVVAGEEGVICEIALPLGGMMYAGEVSELAEAAGQLEEVLYRCGYPHYDLIYTLLFLTSTHLPAIRLTREGILSVKDRRLLRTAQKVASLSG